MPGYVEERLDGPGAHINRRGGCHGVQTGRRPRGASGDARQADCRALASTADGDGARRRCVGMGLEEVERG